MRLQVRVYEAGPGGTAGIPVLADYLQESAAAHADALAVGAEPMAAAGLAWILTRLKIAVTRLPAVGESVDIETWPAALDKRFATRAWRLYDADGQPLADALAHWAAFDIARRRLAPMPDWIGQRVGPGDPPPLAFEGRSLPAPDATEGTVALTPRRTDLDVNGHVNNARLLGWLLEPLPDAEVAALASLDAAFRHECRAGETVESRLGPLHTGKRRHALTRAADRTDLVRAVGVWR
jgi:fatty acyl-ACP thioesterase A